MKRLLSPSLEGELMLGLGFLTDRRGEEGELICMHISAMKYFIALLHCTSERCCRKSENHLRWKRTLQTTDKDAAK